MSTEFNAAIITLAGTIAVSTIAILPVLLRILGQTRMAAAQSREVNDAINHTSTANGMRAYDMLVKAAQESLASHDKMDTLMAQYVKHDQAFDRIEQALKACPLSSPKTDLNTNV